MFAKLKALNLLFIQEGVSLQFFKLGWIVGRHPLYFIIIPILLSTVLSTGLFRITVNRDTDVLFAAKGRRAYKNKALVETLFPMNTSVYADLSRATRQSDRTLVMIMPKKGNSMLRKKLFDELLTLDRTIKNMTIEWNGKFLSYNDVCGKKFGKCVESAIIKLAPHVEDIVKGTYKIKYPLDINNITFAYTQYILSLGGVTLDDQGYVKDVKIIRIFYYFDVSDKSKTKAIEEWQNVLYHKLKSLEYRHISLSFISAEGLSDEFRRYSYICGIRMPVIVFMIATFSFITCITNNWVRSKPWLGPSACFSAGLAVISGFGTAFHLGLEYADYHIALAFVVIGTEIDDAFVLIATWRGTSHNESVENRMAITYQDAAVSVTITSLTNFLSFCVGTSAPFKGIKLFCAFGATFIFYTYLYQITFFGGCLALSGYREKKKLHPFTFKPVNDKEKSASKLEDFNEEYFMAQFRDKIGTLLIHSSTKFIVMLIFFGNLAFGIYATKYLTYGNDLTDAFNSKSAPVRFIETNYKYFNEYTYPVHIFINKTLNYADKEVQKSVEDCLNKFHAHPFVADSSLQISWLKYYKLFASLPAGKFLLSGYNMSDKHDFIDGLRNVFLRFPQAYEFNQDISFNEDFTEITASRFLIPLKNISSQESEIKLLTDLYKIVDKSPLPIGIHSATFHLLEQTFIIKDLTFEIAMITSALICVTFFVFVPNITSALCISVIVFSIIIETVGYMSLWNVKLDFVSLSLLILCVGFSINYPTHLSFSFVMAKNMRSTDRIKKSIYDVGFPIFQGSGSTILSTVILAFEPYYGTKCTFKVVSIIVMQTAFHAMFVMPVLLSILGCCDKSLSFKEPIENKDEELSALTESCTTEKESVV